MNRLQLSLLLIATLPAAVVAQGAAAGPPCRTGDGKEIAVIERSAPGGAGPLVVLLTGDGGWANADQKVAAELTARGSAVIGINMRSYLSGGRTPDETARDFACVARRYSAAWNRHRVLLLGYSRGADIAPFVVARWPNELRERLTMVALISMSTRANFTFHLIDLVRDVQRPDDVAIAPEVQRLRGLRVICVYGADDSTSGCTAMDSTIVKAYARPGGHRLAEGFSGIAALLEPALAPASPPT